MNKNIMHALAILCVVFISGCAPQDELLAPTSTPTPEITPSSTVPAPDAVPSATTMESLLHIGPSKIYLVKPDGSDLSEIALGNRPEFSADGRYLSFVQSDSGDDDLILYERDAETTEIIAMPGPIRAYHWSPDGQSIAAIVNINQSGMLMIYDMSTRQLSTILNWDGELCSASWSLQSDQIAFSAAQEDVCAIRFTSEELVPQPQQVYRIRVDGSDLTTLTHLESSAFDVRWSPVANQIAYLETQGYGRSHLHVMDAANGTESLALDAFGVERIQWSPDGKLIVLGGPAGMYTLDTTTLAKMHFFNSGRTGWPEAWSPDGTTLLVGWSCCGFMGFWLIDVNQPDRARSIDGGGNLTAERTFTSENPVWSPDGDWIAFSAFEGCRCP